MPLVTKTSSLTQSMIESRYRQFDSSSSFALDALDLAVPFEQFARANSLVNAPSGLPFSEDLNLVYNKIIHHLIPLLSNQSTIKNIRDHLKKLWIDGTRGDQFMEFIPTQNRREIAFRIWFRSEASLHMFLVSRVLLIIIRPAKLTSLQPIVLFRQQFGNVDLCLLSSYLLRTVDQEPVPIFLGSDDDIKHYMLPNDLYRVARYLDHGQTLNLSQLKANGFSDLSNYKMEHIADPYQQYLNDIFYYESLANNGPLITRRLPNKLRLLHLTPHKSLIIDSQELRVSRAGCIGSMVYTTSLVGEGSDTLGGHTIGLCNRLGQKPGNENLILLELEQRGNNLTNWIEKLGRGRIFLEARNRVLSTGTYKNHANKLQFMSSIPPNYKKHFFQIHVVSEHAVEMYNQCWDIFYFCIHYAQNIKPNLSIYHKRAENFFGQLVRLLTTISGSEGSKPYYSIFNSVFFETIKDYILLFQSDPDSQRYKEIHSFNMHLQYQIFFELCPQLKINWNTNLFPMDMSNVLTVLKKWGFFSQEDSLDIFMTFFLNRFSYYINVATLEGARKLPPRVHYSFDALSNQLPNLMGNLFNVIINQHKSPTLLESYMVNLRICYALSYDVRNIQVAVKSGICGTDEIGVRPQSHIRFFDVQIVNKEILFTAKPTTPLNLTIEGFSEKSGFTNRCSGYAELNIENLNDSSFNLCGVAQKILEQYYLKPLQPAAVDRSEDTKHFEIKSHKIPRVTHGAMHAARVMLYIKVLHFFRLEQQDPCVIRLIDFAKSVNVNAVVLLHLTQLAALFHDSARLDEGSDRWDKESSINYFNFMEKVLPHLQKELLQLVANTIAFKDDEDLFFTNGLSLGFTKLQMEQSNYLRQLVHDADCLDIMRVKKTFKTKFLEMKAYVNPADLLELVRNVLELIHAQQDQYKDCKIQHDELDLPRRNAFFNIEHKFKYEWNPNVLDSIMEDMYQIPWLKTVFLPWDFELDAKEPSSVSKF